MHKADLHHHAHFIQNSASWELADLSLKRSGRVNSLMTKSGHLWEAANESRRNMRDFFKGLLNAKTLDVKKSVSTWGDLQTCILLGCGRKPTCPHVDVQIPRGKNTRSWFHRVESVRHPYQWCLENQVLLNLSRFSQDLIHFFWSWQINKRKRFPLSKLLEGPRQQKVTLIF